MRTPGFMFCFFSSALALAQTTPPPPAPPPPGETTAAPPRTLDDLARELDAQREQLRLQAEELARLKAVPAPPPPPPAPPAPAEHWYEKIKVRGYSQLRYNQIPSGVDNPDLTSEQGDRSIGPNGGIFLRRARLVLFGDVHPRLSIYFQPDFASIIGDQLGVGILRDWYADIFLDAKKEFRLRAGQSKVPFGFENMQSSQNRLAFDRNDALNSAVREERDMGLFFYWAPEHIRKRFKHLVDDGLKGSGDYGVVALGVYNGQGPNRFELNAFPHVIARVTWPFAIGNQILEIGGGGYYGHYTIRKEDVKDAAGNTIKYTSADPKNTFLDARAHVSIVLYPKPVGFALEYNVGYGPSQGRADPTVIDSRFLHGGYLQIFARFEKPFAGAKAISPYVRAQLYDGGKKFFTNAPRYDVREIEAGVEWQIMDALEVTAAYTVADRTSDKYPYEQEYGHLTRLQLQFNY